MKPQVRRTLSRMVLTGLVVSALAFLSPISLLADSGDPPERVARLGSLQGAVSIQPSGVTQWSEASPNYPVATGDRVYTDRDGRAEVQIGQTVARMWHDTDLTVTNLADSAIQLGLAQGTLHLRTLGLDPRTQVEIDTPNGALTITRPGDVRVDSYTGDGGTVVTVYTGEVELTGPSLSQRIVAGQSLQLVGSNPIEVANLEMPAQDEFDGWSMDRDRHILHSNSARYVSRDAPGYDDLDDYGDWAPATDYGPVWYPRAVPVGWVPYRYGHWVWTGPWGWTWVEDEPWGYAPFHYGRWAYIDSRWGWIPGPMMVRPVWSPALVAFVGGPHFGIGIGIGGVSAWFPLGPGEPYYPWYHCSPRYVNQVNITNIRVTRIVNVQNNYNVTNVTNINYIHRTVATTAVPAQAFRSARPVAANMIHVDPRQLAQAQIVPHPDVKPSLQSVVARPVTNVPVAAGRPTLLTQGGHQAPAVPGGRSQAVPYKPLPPNAMQHAEGAHPVVGGGNPVSVARPGAVPVTGRGSYNPGTANQAGGKPGAMNNGGRQPVESNQAPAQGGTRPLIMRNEPPGPKPSFQQQQPAMNQHPGRPLEPQQIENLHQGQPAGPSRDRELIPHPQPQPRYSAPQQAPRYSPALQHSAPQPHSAAPPQRNTAPAAQRRPAPAPRPTAGGDRREHN